MFFCQTLGQRRPPKAGNAEAPLSFTILVQQSPEPNLYIYVFHSPKKAFTPSPKGSFLLIFIH